MSACTSCGACCASFRVDFSVFETQERGGSVPDGLVVEVTSSTRRMRGTDHTPPRCAALTGKIGATIACRDFKRPISEYGGHKLPGEDQWGNSHDQPVRMQR